MEHSIHASHFRLSVHTVLTLFSGTLFFLQSVLRANEVDSVFSPVLSEAHPCWNDETGTVIIYHKKCAYIISFG